MSSLGTNSPIAIDRAVGSGMLSSSLSWITT